MLLLVLQKYYLSCPQAYARFSGAPLQFRVVGSPFSSPSGKLPVFRHGRVVLTQFSEIVAYLKQKVNLGRNNNVLVTLLKK